MIVVDASVAVKWFVEEQGHLPALDLLQRGFAIVAETANVLWKKLRRNEVTADQAGKACRTLPECIHRVVPTASLVEHALDLARRLDHPVYDCVYLVCAQQEGLKLVTADERFVSHLADSGLSRFVCDLQRAADQLAPDPNPES